MYRAVALIVLCMAIVTMVGSWQRTNAARFTKELEVLQREVSDLRGLAHSVTTLEQEIDQLQARLSAAGPPQSQAVTRSRYTPTNNFSDDAFLGNRDAPILLMAFGDYQCNACQSFWQRTLPVIKEGFIDKGTLQFVFRDFPLKSHTQAKAAAEVAHCAGEQGAYWEAFHLLFDNRKKVDAGDFQSLVAKIPEINADKLLRCVKADRYSKEITADQLEGKSLGAKGIPGFFLGKLSDKLSYEGVFIRGAQPTEVFLQEIKKLN